MTKASDNVYPKVLLGPLGAPAAPSDASWKLYPMADGVYARSSNTTMGPLGAASGSMATDALWDAAGDLAVGTGANTAAKLVKGADGGTLAMGNGAVIWNAGTSFPGSKATGDRYWRTDLGQEFYWDGTRWLTTQIFEHHIGNWVGVTLSNTQVDTAALFEGDFDCYVLKLYATMYTVTTLSGSAYWTLNVNFYAGGTAGSVIASVTNQSGTADVYARKASTVNALMGTATTGISTAAVKTSTPGALYAGAMLTYRIVGT